MVFSSSFLGHSGFFFSLPLIAIETALPISQIQTGVKRTAHANAKHAKTLTNTSQCLLWMSKVM